MLPGSRRAREFAIPAARLPLLLGLPTWDRAEMRVFAILPRSSNPTPRGSRSELYQAPKDLQSRSTGDSVGLGRYWLCQAPPALASTDRLQPRVTRKLEDRCGSTRYGASLEVTTNSVKDLRRWLANHCPVVRNLPRAALAPQPPASRFDCHPAIVGRGFDINRGPVLLEPIVERLPHRGRNGLRFAIRRGLRDRRRHIVDRLTSLLERRHQLIIRHRMISRDQRQHNYGHASQSHNSPRFSSPLAARSVEPDEGRVARNSPWRGEALCTFDHTRNRATLPQKSLAYSMVSKHNPFQRSKAPAQARKSVKLLI